MLEQTYSNGCLSGFSYGLLFLSPPTCWTVNTHVLIWATSCLCWFPSIFSVHLFLIWFWLGEYLDTALSVHFVRSSRYVLLVTWLPCERFKEDLLFPVLTLPVFGLSFLPFGFWISPGPVRLLPSACLPVYELCLYLGSDLPAGLFKKKNPFMQLIPVWVVTNWNILHTQTK